MTLRETFFAERGGEGSLGSGYLALTQNPPKGAAGGDGQGPARLASAVGSEGLYYLTCARRGQ